MRERNERSVLVCVWGRGVRTSATQAFWLALEVCQEIDHWCLVDVGAVSGEEASLRCLAGVGSVSGD